MARSAPPQPMMPDGAACGLTTTRSPTFRPLTSTANVDDLAGRLVPQRNRLRLAARPYRHAAHVQEGHVGAADAAGAYPQHHVLGARNSALMSNTSMVPGAPVCTDFIVAMVHFPCKWVVYR